MDDRELVAITPRMAEAGKAKLIELGYEGVEFTDAQKVYLAMLEASPAALAKAGRLASEVGGDVVEEAKIAGTAALVRGGYGDVAGTAARVVIEAASGILATDAERRVRAEIENIVSDAILQSQALGRSELELRLDAITAIRNGVPHA